MSASVAAVFNAADANHDGVLTQEEFAAATAPVVYAADPIALEPIYYTAPPVYVTAAEGVTTTEMAEAPVIYSSAAPMTYTTAPMTYVMPETDTYQPGERIIYQSVTTGQTYPGSVVDMYTDGGCQIILDIDGGVKDLFLEDMVRLTRETATTEEAPTAAPVSKKVKSSKVKKSKKGCC